MNGLLPCGHPEGCQATTVESRTVFRGWCQSIEIQRDAIAMEKEYREKCGELENQNTDLLDTLEAICRKIGYTEEVAKDAELVNGPLVSDGIAAMFESRLSVQEICDRLNNLQRYDTDPHSCGNLIEDKWGELLSIVQIAAAFDLNFDTVPDKYGQYYGFKPRKAVSDE